MKKPHFIISVLVSVCFYCLAACVNDSTNGITLGPNEGIRILKPNGSEQYRIGDTLTLKWVVDTAKAPNALIPSVSVSNGLSWLELIGDANLAIKITDSKHYDGMTGEYKWVITDSILTDEFNQETFSFIKLSTVSSQCKMRIEEAYRAFGDEPWGVDISDNTFSILPRQ
jgi:hypothetical protein